ncbi:MAG: NUDIX domain-containing protein, partial [Pseudomonadota bacterium]
TARRLQEELGVQTQLEWLYKFTYQADYDEAGNHVGAEHELCHVLIGAYDGDIEVHPDEIAAWRWVSAEQIEQELAEQPQVFTPWFKLEWQELAANWQAQVQALHGRRKSA